MNKYAIYCDDLTDEQLLKDWIKKEFNSDYYTDNDLYESQALFHFPSLWDGNDFQPGDHLATSVRTPYTKINIKDFLKEYNKNMKTELLGLPIINGKKHHLEAFIKDVEKFGYSLSTYCYNTEDGAIKLNTNSDREAYTEDGFKILCCVYSAFYTGDPTLPVKRFNLPQDWSIALTFMEENMDRWNKIQEENKEPEFKMGDYVIASNSLTTYIGVYKSGVTLSKWKPIDQDHITNCNGDFDKIERLATLEEIAQFNNLPKIFKMTSTSGNFELEVSKKGIFYRPEDKWLIIEGLDRMLKETNTVVQGRQTYNTIGYDWKVESITVGCKTNIPIRCWQEVYNYYKSLQ